MDVELADRIRGAWDAYLRRNEAALPGLPGSGRAAVMSVLKHTMDLYWILTDRSV